MLIRFFLLFILSFTFAFSALKDDLDNTSKLIANPLYGLHEQEITNILNDFLNNNPNIKYTIVYDTIVNSKYLSYYKDKNGNLIKQHFDENKLHTKCTKISSNINYQNEQIGKIIICYEKTKVSLNLTKEEKEWIKNNPTIKVSNEYDWAPFNFNRNGIPHGYSIDYIKMLANSAGLDVNFVTGTWDELLNKVFNKEIDVMMNIAKTKSRQEHLLYVNVFARNVTSILTKESRTDITNIESLFGKKVSVVKGFFYEKFLRDKYPKIEVVTYNNTLDSIKAIVYDEVDATLGKTAILNYLLSENMLKGLKYTSDVKANDPETENLYIATRDDAPLLQSILKKAMKEVSLEQIDQLKLKWFNQKRKIQFTKKEYQWLDKKKVIRYSEVNWRPLSIIENNAMSGIIGDYLNIVSEYSGIEFKFIPSKSWPDVLEKFKNGEIDLVPGIGDSKNETSLGLISNKFASYPMVIVTNDNIDYASSLEDIKNRIFSLPKYYTSYNYLKDLYPNAKIIETKNIFEALLNVSNGDADVYIGHIAPALYYMSKIGKDNLKIAGETGKDFNHHYLINPKMPELLSVVNKVFETITEKDREKIYNGWVKVKIKQNTGFSLKKILYYALPPILIIILLILIVVYWNRKLKSLVEKKTKDIKNKKEELQNLVNSFDRNVIFVQTNLQGIITHPSQAFCKISGYDFDELINKPVSIIKHPDTSKKTHEDLWKTIKANLIWQGEFKNRNKEGKDYWLYSKIEPEYNNENHQIGYKAISQDITNRKIVEDLSKNLELKVEERTYELEVQKAQIEIILENIMLPVLITSKKDRTILYANEYSSIQYEIPVEKLIGKSIDTVYTNLNQKDEILTQMEKYGYVENLEQRYKTNNGKEFIALLSVKPIKYKDEDAYIGMVVDVTKQKDIEKEIKLINKQMKDSIEYASLIQHALIPSNDLFRKYFSDYLTIWHPKDIVGGDIYLFEELRDDNECILMVIDCTGHGVPGAFVTMLVKAIERQIVSNIKNSNEIVSPAKILSIFNKSMKHLLKQEDEYSISNAGFDGGILYYNKKERIIKFAGAQIPLFYEYQGEIKIIKGDRQSIGYKKSDANFEFNEFTVEVKEGMQFYITTDGYLDQNGGEKDFPFGKKRFAKIIKENYKLPFADQQEVFLYEMMNYQGNNDRNDDMAIVGIKI
jgi:PAS domain S-box-containing protein